MMRLLLSAGNQNSFLLEGHFLQGFWVTQVSFTSNELKIIKLIRNMVEKNWNMRIGGRKLNKNNKIPMTQNGRLIIKNSKAKNANGQINLPYFCSVATWYILPQFYYKSSLLSLLVFPNLIRGESFSNLNFLCTKKNIHCNYFFLISMENNSLTLKIFIMI